MDSILMDARWFGTHGVGRFAQEVAKRLPTVTLLRTGPKVFHYSEQLYLRRMLRKYRPSVYFTPSCNPPILSPVPFVFCLHDLGIVDRRPGWRLSQRCYFESVVRIAARKAYRVLTISEYSRRRIVEWSGLTDDRVVNVSAGVDEAFSPDGPRWEPGYPYFCYVGDHRPHKNLRRLIEAFSRAGLDKRMRLVLTGNPDTGLPEYARRFGVDQRIVFANGISDVELPPLLRGARALVLVSFCEGLGLPVVEAMASGTPVLASNVTALPEIAGDAALLVNPLDSGEIGAGLRAVIEDETLRSDLIRNGLVRSKKFSWNCTGARINEVLAMAAHEF